MQAGANAYLREKARQRSRAVQYELYREMVLNANKTYGRPSAFAFFP